jgi:Sulfotransferase domain
LHTGAIASGREWVEAALDFDLNELSFDEVDRLRPSAYRWLSQQMDSPGYHKIHDAYTYLPDGEPLIPIEATKGALCIIRNPLDVAISFANHNNCTIDKSIEHMANNKYALSGQPKRFHNQLRQWLLSWSEHVSSWADAPNINKKIVRYEDMKHTPIETFTQIASFLELPNDKESITTALEHCKIEKLQAQEAQSSFREKAAKSERFFRKGIVGDWQNTLTDQQVKTIIKDHRVIMQRFGYLDTQEQPSETINYREAPAPC